jgi:hypothetical protein
MKLCPVQKAIRLSVYLFPLFLGSLTQCGIKKPVATQYLQEGPHSHLYKDSTNKKENREGTQK